MPIEFSENIRALDQEAFGAITYDVMEQAINIFLSFIFLSSKSEPSKLHTT